MSTNLSAEGVVTKSFSKKEGLDTIPLDPFPVGPVLWFFPEISLNTKVEGGSSGTFELALEESGAFEVGVSYSSKDGPDYQPPSPTYTSGTPTVSVMDEASISAGIGPRIHLRLYTFAGPYATIWAQAGIDADVDSNPCWQLTGGFSIINQVVDGRYIVSGDGMPRRRHSPCALSATPSPLPLPSRTQPLPADSAP